MSDEDTETSAVLEALESAGLAEVYLDDDGHETMRLTEEGASLAQELRIFEHGPGPDEASRGGGAARQPPPLDLTNSFGTAVGAAMLGFEQALRSEPPPEILAADHVPERGLAGDDGGVVVEFPERDDRTDR
jgi:hypothetical protein